MIPLHSSYLIIIRKKLVEILNIVQTNVSTLQNSCGLINTEIWTPALISLEINTRKGTLWKHIMHQRQENRFY